MTGVCVTKRNLSSLVSLTWRIRGVSVMFSCIFTELKNHFWAMLLGQPKDAQFFTSSALYTGIQVFLFVFCCSSLEYFLSIDYTLLWWWLLLLLLLLFIVSCLQKTPSLNSVIRGNWGSILFWNLLFQGFMPLLPVSNVAWDVMNSLKILSFFMIFSLLALCPVKWI